VVAWTQTLDDGTRSGRRKSSDNGVATTPISSSVAANGRLWLRRLARGPRLHMMTDSC